MYSTPLDAGKGLGPFLSLFLDELADQHLAGRRTRKLVEALYAPRHLEGGEGRTACAEDLVIRGAADDEQRRDAEESKQQAQARHPRPIVTEIEPAAKFWPAEDYHQRYLEKRGLSSCTLELAETTESV